VLNFVVTIASTRTKRRSRSTLTIAHRKGSPHFRKAASTNRGKSPGFSDKETSVSMEIVVNIITSNQTK
jgi:hypothetical protein